ncbi:hypothetical protein NA57DRAFT_78228 [Rhizodiscina lignyota]|uniref:Arrestin-like N-terminal domain-containing protein n=1 Tax=Rhizodiscina lignyota TaxID=1504668 RepID=A0A9P4M6S4_9PEZI|nr:hypothetical protein NA57DRAFT_78228 [Rhizodiscina lignyota]
MSSIKLSFQFSNTFPTSDERVPLFLRNTGVAGALSVQDGNGRIDTIKLVLKGKVTNAVQSGPSGLNESRSLVIQQTLLNLVDVQDAAFGLPSEDGTWRQYPFDFCFSKRCHGRKCDGQPIVLQTCNPSLPSSLDVTSGPRASEWKIETTTSSRVSYEIQAWAFLDDVVQAATSQEIRLYDPPCVPPPPMILEHFRGEFTPRQEKKIMKGMLKSTGKLAIAVSEPTPAEIQHGNGLVQTDLPIRLEICDRKGLPSRLEMRVKSTLHGSTFISSEKMKEMPSRYHVIKSPTIQEVKTKARTFTQKLNVACRWQKDERGTWYQQMTVPLPLVANQTPPPTFKSAVVARRYSVSLRIEVSDGVNATFDLKVPVQILYSTGEEEDDPDLQTSLNGTRIEDLTNALDDLVLRSRPPAEQLPLYVR